MYLYISIYIYLYKHIYIHTYIHTYTYILEVDRNSVSAPKLVKFLVSAEYEYLSFGSISVSAENEFIYLGLCSYKIY